MSKELVFSVTASDCDWSYTRGTGKGGQKRNKTNSAVHCSHRPSGGHGYAEDSRSQYDNKRTAFERMCNTKEFQAWLKMEFARQTGVLQQIEQNVEKEMRRIKVEVKEEGLWVEVPKDAPLPD